MTTPEYYKLKVKVTDDDGTICYQTLECKDLIEALIESSGYEWIDAYNYGNVIKYIFRMNRKGFGHFDAEKAITYLNEILPEDMKYVRIELKRLDNES